jgi:hypothetical protein
VKQNINAEGISEFHKKTIDIDIRDTSVKIKPQLTVFWDKHVALRMTVVLKEVLKESMVTQHKSKRQALRRGKQGLSCARAFYFVNRDKSFF